MTTEQKAKLICVLPYGPEWLQRLARLDGGYHGSILKPSQLWNAIGHPTGNYDEMNGLLQAVGAISWGAGRGNDKHWLNVHRSVIESILEVGRQQAEAELARWVAKTPEECPNSSATVAASTIMGASVV